MSSVPTSQTETFEIIPQIDATEGGTNKGLQAHFHTG